MARKQRVVLTWGWNFCLLSLPSEEWDLQATRLYRKGAAREVLTLILKYGSAKVFGAVFTCSYLLA